MSAQITVGLDFGTHQTKVCVERKEGAEHGYSFFKFRDTRGWLRYTLPSIIKINPNGSLKYGYIRKSRDSQILRYFKQATFTTSPTGMSKENAILYSIWYIAFILFDLEEEYGQNFTIQMGVPTDSSHLEAQQRKAVSILLSAYHLVEDVFENDKEAFLDTTVYDLRKKTKIIPFTKDKKEEYGILVFPEAYACLMPLVSTSKISEGMSLMVDIGGGTTDISFFSIGKDKENPNNQLRVYDFRSINKGLNFLTGLNEVVENDRIDSNVQKNSELVKSAINIFKNELNGICLNLKSRLYKEFKSQGDITDDRFNDALENRPIVYTGGGSSFETLRHSYLGFEDKIHISQENWQEQLIEDMDEIIALGLCPILSTAYGLSISKPNDKITCEPFRDIFSGLRQTKGMKNESQGHSFNYYEDYDAWK